MDTVIIKVTKWHKIEHWCREGVNFSLFDLSVAFDTVDYNILETWIG